MTTAEEIADRYGREWEDANGVDIAVACLAEAPNVDIDATTIRRYEFEDGSVILIAPLWWDLGRFGCFCPAHVMHQADCTSIPAVAS